MKRALGFLALPLLVAGLAWMGQRAIDASAPGVRTETPATKTLAYRIAHAQPTRFRLTADDETISIASYHEVAPAHLNLPQHTYSVHARVLVDGRERWRQVYALETRRSAAPADATPSAVWSRDGRAYADERMLEIDVPAALRGGLLELRAEAGAAFAARVFRLAPRSDDGIAAKRRGLDLEAEHDLAARWSYLPWDAMPADLQADRLRRRWQRIPADGDRGVDYAATTLWITDPDRLAAPAPTVTPGIAIGPTHDAAINVVGPTVVRVVPVDGVTPGGAVRATLYGADAGPSVAELAVPAGPHTVVLASTRPTRVAVTVADNAWLAPSTTAREPAPHLVRIAYDALDPSTPLTFALWPTAARTPVPLYLETRVIDPATEETEPPTVTFVDADGRVLERERLPLNPTASRFDAWPAPDGVRTLSEPMQVALRIPAATARIEVTGPGRVIVRAQRRIDRAGDTTVALRPPYDIATPEARWRFAPPVSPAWVTVRPIARAPQADAHDAGAGVIVEAQVRLTPGGGGLVDGEPRRWYAVTSTGAPVVRGLRSHRGDELGGLTLWRQLRTDVPGTLRIDVGRNTRPRLYWEAPADAVGQTIGLELAGARTDVPMRTARDTHTLPATAAGASSIRVTLPPGVRAFVDAPLRPAAATYAERGYARLAPGARVAVPVQVDADGPTAVLALVHRETTGAAPTVRWSIGGGRPARRADAVVAHITQARGEGSLTEVAAPPEVRLIDDGDRRLRGAYRLRMTLGTDLVPGTHEVELVNAGPAPLWVRFVADHPPARPDRAPTRWQVYDSIDDE